MPPRPLSEMVPNEACGAELLVASCSSQELSSFTLTCSGRKLGV